MRKRISTFTKKKFTNSIRSVISDLSRPVEVFKKPATFECFNCFYDKLTKSSTNTCRWTLAEALQKQSDYVSGGGIGTRYKYFSHGRCPICKGKGFLETIRKVWVNCKVNWDPESEGTLINDTVGVSGNLVVELKADPKYLTLFRDCVSLRVDNIECKLAKPPMIRGMGESSLLVLLAFAIDNIAPPIDDSIKEYK